MHIFYANYILVSFWFFVVYSYFGIIHSAVFSPVLFLLLVVGCTARPLYPLPSRVAEGARKPLQTFRPYNIAHRGSNGEIPEETVPAYMVTVGMPIW